MPGPYRVDLVREQTVNTASPPGYVLNITGQAPLNMSEKIFVYRRTGLGNNVFEGICTPSQLSSLPATNPDPEYLADPTRFRLATFTAVFAKPSESTDAWQDVYLATQSLIKELDAVDLLVATETVRIGTSTLTHSSDAYLQ